MPEPIKSVRTTMFTARIFDVVAEHIRLATGKLARQWRSLGEIHPASGFCSEIQYGFLATGLSLCDPNYDDDERIDITTVTSAQVAEAIRTSAMTDGKSIAICIRAKLSGLV